jgi:hypothetical protein
MPRPMPLGMFDPNRPQPQRQACQPPLLS